jgi:ribonuclease HI
MGSTYTAALKHPKQRAFSPPTVPPLRVGFLPSGRRHRTRLVRIQLTESGGGIELNPGPPATVLKVMQFNCEGFRPKLSELQKTLDTLRIDVVLLQETRCPAAVLAKVKGYNVLAETRQIGRSTSSRPSTNGGVAILIRDNIKYSQDKTRATTAADLTTETVRAKVYPTENPKFCLNFTSIYIPPIRTSSSDSRVQSFDERALPNGRNCFIMGDFNGHSQLWDNYHSADAIGRQIEDFLASNGFTCANDCSPTFLSRAHGTRSSPDVSLMHSSWSTRVSWRVGECLGGSDHLPIFMDIACERSLQLPTQPRSTRFSYRKANWPQFQERVTAGTPHDTSVQSQLTSHHDTVERMASRDVRLHELPAVSSSKLPAEVIRMVRRRIQYERKVRNVNIQNIPLLASPGTMADESCHASPTTANAREIRIASPDVAPLMSLKLTSPPTHTVKIPPSTPVTTHTKAKTPVQSQALPNPVHRHAIHGIGIRNTGNTCFAAAGLQALFGDSNFTATIQSHECDVSNECASCCTRAILNARTCVAPTDLLNTATMVRLFSSRAQQYESAQFMEALCVDVGCSTQFVTIIPSMHIAEQLAAHWFNECAFSTSEVSSPPALAIVIDRFLDNATKDVTPIDIGEALGYADASYTLVGIVEHIGSSPTCGHFVAWSKRQGTWAKYNDSLVQPGPPSKQSCHQACALVFCRDLLPVSIPEDQLLQRRSPAVQPTIVPLLPDGRKQQNDPRLPTEVNEQASVLFPRPVFLTPRMPSIHPKKTARIQQECVTSTGSVHARYRKFCATVLEAAKATIPRGARRNPKMWWDAECDEAVRRRQDARKDAHICLEKKKEYIELCRATKRLLDAKRSDAWQKFVTEELTPNTGVSQVHQVIRSIDGRRSNTKPAEVMKSPLGTKLLISDQDKATAFVKQYAAVCRIEPRSSDRALKYDNVDKLKPERCPCRISSDSTVLTHCSPFRMSELLQAIREIKPRKAPGSDQISNEMLRNLPAEGNTELLGIINDSWNTCEVPAAWRTGNIIPLLKKGKPSAEMSSYRPIVLTSCIAKVAERMVRNRLVYILETTGAITQHQAGFRPARTTEDQISRFITEVNNGFQRRDRTVASMIDFSRAFDTVHIESLLRKLLMLGVPVCMTRWLRAFLKDRRANVQFGTATSAKHRMTNGLPQGTVLGPILFVCFINDLAKVVPEETHISLFADDVCLWAQDRTIEGAASALQEGLHTVEQFADEMRLRVSKDKTTVTAFTLNTHEAKTAPTVFFSDGTPVAVAPEPTFLGITFDRTLSFRAHEHSVARRMTSRISTLHTLAGTSWGCSMRHMRQLYQSYCLSVAEYACGSWFHTGSATLGSAVTRSEIEVIHHRAARMITGCPKATPTEKLLIEANLVPLSVRAEELSAHTYERHMRLPLDHPSRLATCAEVKARAKSRRDWRNTAKEVIERSGLTECERQQIVMAPPFEPWTDLGVNVTFSDSLAVPCSRSEPADEKLDKAIATMDAVREDDMIEIFTDGSVADSVGCGGGGICIKLPNGDTTKLKVPAGSRCTSFYAEMTAILTALQYLLDSDLPANVAIFTDSQSAIRSLQSGPLRQKDQLTISVWSHLIALFPASESRTCTMQYVPAHCGILGNEEADTLAAEGAKMKQTHQPLPLSTARQTITRSEKARWRNNCSRRPYVLPPHNAPPNLPRRIERIMSQIRVECCPLFRNYLHRIGKSATPNCRGCGMADESAYHVITDCPAYDARRRLLPSTSLSQDNALTVYGFLRAIGLAGGDTLRSDAAQ